jgi:hypothetical protein
MLPQPLPRQWQSLVIRIHAKLRKLDSIHAVSWGYILIERNEIVPPVLIRDELPIVNGERTFLQPRAATSLLRRATELEPPFCFLQFEPHDEAINVRGMLCALILYYALISGLTDSATRW